MKRIIPIISTIILLGALAMAVFFHSSEQEHQGFDLGLDLAGGTQLTYRADISDLEAEDVEGSIQSLQTVLERRLNGLGLSDIKVTTETASVFAENSDSQYRVNIEIPGVFDVEEAKSMIGKIPTLEFRLGPNANSAEGVYFVPSATTTASTGLYGRHVQTANIAQTQYSTTPSVNVIFTDEGGDIFYDLTRDNVGHYLVILLDGEVISYPVIQAAIPGGETIISGSTFTFESASALAQNLQFGALPVPIDLISTQSISPSLGQDIIVKGVLAGAVAYIIMVVLLISLYRIAGVVGSITLAIYGLILLAFFKVTGVDMTAAGIAGFVITIGMAVDANVLIYERIREELADAGKTAEQAVRDGFARAWLSIRDGNASSIIVAIILYYMTTSFVKGFALVFGVGIAVSMLTAVVFTRSLLLAVTFENTFIRTHLTGRVK